MSDREYAASLVDDQRRDWGRQVHRDTQPVVGDYRPWDESGRPAKHEIGDEQ